MKPTIEAIAALYASVLGDDPAPEAQAWFHWLLCAHPTLAQLWAQLESSTEAGVSLLELASLFFAAGAPQRFPRGGPLLDHVLGLEEHTRALRDRLVVMADDLGRERLSAERWATETLRAYRLFDQLVANLDAADPVETLDPGDFRGVPYEQLIAVCDARLRERAHQKPRATSGPGKEELETLRALLVRHLRRHTALPDLEVRIHELESWLTGHEPTADLAEWLEAAAAAIREHDAAEE